MTSDSMEHSGFTLRRSPPIYNVLLLGDPEVGKTAIALRLSDDVFSSAYVPTIGLDFQIRVLTVGEKEVKLKLWDSAGQEKFHKAIQSPYYTGADAVMFVYDVLNSESLHAVEKWLNLYKEKLQNCKHVNPEKIPVMLIGNKIDIEVHDRQVSFFTAQDFARQHRMLFMEVSARYNINITRAFQKLADEIHSLQRPRSIIKRFSSKKKSLEQKNKKRQSKLSKLNCCTRSTTE